VVTCIEPDHLENYPGGIDEIRDCFYAFLDKAPIKVINIDDPLLAAYAKANLNSSQLAADSQPSTINYQQIISYSASELNNYDLKLSMPGKHNKMNALACIKAAEQLGIKTETAIQSLESFTGIKRRFELINANYKGIKVYDDYAHHPTEVKAALEGALSLKPKKLVFVYQPHHPERTKQLWDEFVEVFKTFPEPHLCLIADIYVARSKHIDGINSERMVKEINKPNVRYLAPASNIETTVQGNYANIAELLKPGIDAELEACDYLFIVGAGDIAKVAAKFQAA
jgi:UDP-N-acetylmuramate--alanine ligase